MIVDSSAIIAVAKGEPDAPAIYQALVTASGAILMSAATLVELGIVIDTRRDPTLTSRADELLTKTGVVIRPVTAQQALIARQAYRDYGKGSGHRARLNFGDCFTYALAKDTGEPVLFTGDDFGFTDLRAVPLG